MTGDIGQDPAWTNPSVQRLSGDADPLATISALVDDLLLTAADAGAVGAPTDPFQLASLMGVALRPRFDVADARLVAAGGAGESAGAEQPGAEPSVGGRTAPLARFVPADTPLVIEYNPTRPRGRLRYSVAHELAHAFFPDAAEEIRHRTYTGAVEELAADDSWQLELLCNIAAAEILMPAAAIAGLVNIDTDIDFLMAQRARFHVSTEALLRRLVHATDRPLALAAFSRVRESGDSPLRCDYVLGSRAWRGPLARGTRIDADQFGGAPSAVGQTARGAVTLAGGEWVVQAVGAPPYSGRLLPRVLSLFEPADSQSPPRPGLTHVVGDLTEAVRDASTDEPVVIGHVVSDSVRGWGRYGVAGALARALPDAATAFRAWTIADEGNLALGNVHAVTVPNAAGVAVTVVSLVAQAGYAAQARLSYVDLAQALDRLAAVATTSGATVHMPRIGVGAGGRWDLIEATIERTLLAGGVRVVVHTLGSTPAPGRNRTGGA